MSSWQEETSSIIIYSATGAVVGCFCGQPLWDTWKVNIRKKNKSLLSTTVCGLISSFFYFAFGLKLPIFILEHFFVTEMCRREESWTRCSLAHVLGRPVVFIHLPLPFCLHLQHPTLHTQGLQLWEQEELLTAVRDCSPGDSDGVYRKRQLMVDCLSTCFTFLFVGEH